MSNIGKIQTTFTKTGSRRYLVEVRHVELNKYQVIRSDNRYIVEQKARAKAAEWDEMWKRKQETLRKQQETLRKQQEREQRGKDIEGKKEVAAERTEEAEKTLGELETILAYTLDVNDAIDWASLKNKADFPSPKPASPPSPTIPLEPQRTDSRYEIKVSWLEDFIDGIFTSRREARKKEVEKRFKADHQKWQTIKTKLEEKHQETLAEYKKALSSWEEKRATYLHERDKGNAEVDVKKQKYVNKDPEAIIDYCDLVLSNSKYPDYFPQSYDIDYNPQNCVLIVDYQFPPIDRLPTLKEVRYVQTRDEFDEKYISQAQLNSTYDLVLYQIVLRTIHELLEADVVNALDAVAFNGYVDSINPATGQMTHTCVLSVVANKEEFEQINLANVEPKACFKKLKGVGSSKLHSLTAIAPIIQLERDDERFIDGYAVAEHIEEGDNLAAMDWEDFEHLVHPGRNT